ncbi:MAG: hypothetical protein WCH43_10870 [Verrucomicrobiota bacterium]
MFPRSVSYGRASATGQSLDMRDIQQTQRHTHRHHQRLIEHGFGFNDDHERTPVSWFQYPDEDEFAEDNITDMPLTTRSGGLRQKRSNGAAINRPVFPVNDPYNAARFVQFLIDHKYAPGATAALFITAGIERRFNYRVADDVGVTHTSMTRWLTKARKAMTSETVIVPPVELPEPEPKHNPRITEYWHKTRKGRDGNGVREAVKAAMRKMLEAQPDISDATLARMLTERARVTISRRTVAKYRMALGIRRQGTLKDAIAEAMTRDPQLTAAELAAKLSESTGRQVSAQTAEHNRLRLGIRKHRKHRLPGQTHRPLTAEARKKISEAMKQRHVTNPLSAAARQKIAAAAKCRWEKIHTDSTQTAGLTCGNLRESKNHDPHKSL